MPGEARREYRRKYYQEHKESFHQAGYKYKKKWRQRIKREVLAYYSNSEEPRCLWCGFSDIRALSIDHIDGGGAKERREKVHSIDGRNIYPWLKKQGYPEGYQTLCMNCQWIKRAVNKEFGGGL